MLEMADLRFPVEMTGKRYKIEILMSRTQKLRGGGCCFAQSENIKRQFLNIRLSHYHHPSQLHEIII